MVWPFLLLGYCATAAYNLKAGGAFILCLIAVQIIKHFGIDNEFVKVTSTLEINLEQLAFFAIYSCVGIMGFLFFDRMSGVAFLACGVIYGLHVFGVIPHYPKMIAAEIVLVAGMLASVFGGPSGGYLADSGAYAGFGWPSIDPRWQSVLQGIVGRV